MKKTFKKILVILLILMYLLPMFQSVSLAATEISEANIIYDHDCGYHLQYWHNNSWHYVIISFVKYKAPNGQYYPAYCLNPDRAGVGPDISNYEVSIDNVMDDIRVWRVAINGYPYKSASDLGVENDDDAFVATKHAIYSILAGRDVNAIDSYYHGGDARGEKIVNAIKNLVYQGFHGTQTRSDALVNITKQGGFVQDSNSNYYSQTYSVSSNVQMGSYTVTGIAGFPEGTVVTDVNNNPKTSFNAGENFKVLVQKTKMTSDLNGIVSVQAKCKTYPVFFGQSPSNDLQNYCVTFDPYGDSSGVARLEVKAEGQLDLEKVSVKNNIWTGNIVGSAVPNAEYTIKNSSGAVVKTLITNAQGKAQVTLPVGKYTIYESKSPDFFLKDDKVYEFEITYHGNISNFKVKENVVEGGYFSAKKTSSLNNVWTGHKVNDPVAGATYGIYTLDGKIVDYAGDKAIRKSDSKGVIFDKYKLKCNSYYMQEIEPAPYFQHDETKYYFKIENNEQSVTLDVQNRPVEGGYVNFKKVSSGNNLWTGHLDGDPVAGATYRIESLDKDWHMDVTTNENGEIVEPDFTSNDIELTLGNFKCYEISEPNGFKLNEEEKYFTLDKNEESIKINLKDIPVEAGKVQVTKTAADYNYKNGVKKGEAVVGAIYKIYRVDDDKEVATLTVTEDATTNIAVIEKGSYYIKETWVSDEWQLNDTPVYFTIDKNEDNKYFDFTNEPVPVGFLNINKTVLEDNTLNGDKEGMPLEGVEFELQDSEGNVLMTLVTDKKGKFSEEIMLDKGVYYLYESKCPDYYVKSDKPDVFEIKENGQKVIIDIKNKPAEAKIDVEKTGLIQAQPNDEIRYDFNTVANNSNVPVDNFTMTDNLPYEYIEMKKLFTGIYSDEVSFNVLYKTNLTEDYVLFKENLNSKVNNYVNFEEIELQEGEVITDYKLEFGTVPVGFKAETTPFMFAKVRSTVKADDIWTNKVSLTATYLDVKLEDKDEWTTISYGKELEVVNQKLPRTGM